MTTQEIKTELKSNKIGRGCKFNILSNCVTIVYPQHKLWNGNFSHKGSQKENDLICIKNNYSIAAKKGTIVQSTKRAIQIYLNN